MLVGAQKRVEIIMNKGTREKIIYVMCDWYDIRKDAINELGYIEDYATYAKVTDEIIDYIERFILDSKR